MWSGERGDFRCDSATKRPEHSLGEVGVWLEIERARFCDQGEDEVGSERLRAA